MCMALLYFYDATEVDKQQLSAELAPTDHHWEYIQGQISLENLNPDTEVISVFVTSSVTKEIIDRLPKLRLIACRSTGFNNIDLAAAAARDITVVNVPSYGEKTVAEYTFALLLALTRRLQIASTHIDTADQPLMMGSDLAGKTIGILGTGRIGSNVIRIAKGFAMNVIAYDPHPNNDRAQELDFTYVSLQDLYAQSDVISLHVPYTQTNKHLINHEAFKAMKRGVIIINTSRGELIDTSALILALQDGTVAQAGLDVIENEHIMSLHGELELLQTKNVSQESYLHSVELLALQKMPNVLLTPHNAFNTVEALARINQTTADNIVKFWYGTVPNKVVPPPATMGQLLIARHTESEWNAEGKWSGTRDVHLDEKGFKEAAKLGLLLPKIEIAQAYASQQIRTLETLSGMLDASQNFEVPIERVASINERDYGDFTGKNKWEVKELIGEEAFEHLRRGWNYPVPNGETLKDVYNRTLPFYLETVVPQLKQGKNILIVAHGNSIRSLMHYIENIAEDQMEHVEMLFGTLLHYQVDQEGKMVSKEEYKLDGAPPPA